ncbi:unnamed protein product [Peronospora belbahrii]|uniref:Uncharacterized protein n=1 Tax=Peronospora belbahrii TaxID=622444 RepID=A0AAU9L5T4_9STRA|nr:unnamed protein product [Peronospora belbahrii]
MSIDLERGFRKVFADSSHNNGGVGSVLALVCTPLENEDDKKALRRVQLEAQVQLLRRPHSPPGDVSNKLAIHVPLLRLDATHDEQSNS